MFRIHRLFIKTAIVYLVLGVGLGGWLLLRKTASGEGSSHDLTLVHTHLLLVGFMLMMVMGVSHWMFPRQPGVGKEARALGRGCSTITSSRSPRTTATTLGVWPWRSYTKGRPLRRPSTRPTRLFSAVMVLTGQGPEEDEAWRRRPISSL